MIARALAAQWSLYPPPLLAALIGAGVYLRAAGRQRTRPWPPRRTASFICGLVLLTVALESGLDSYGERLASVHMVQHLLIALVVAPLLVAGAPITLTLRATGGTARSSLARLLRSRFVRALGRWQVSWSLLPAVIVVWHLSPLYEAGLRHPLLHDLEHVVLLSAALVFWAPVLGADPVRHAPGWVGRLLYLLGAMPVMSAVGIALATGHSVRYPAYLVPARALGISPLADQHLAGMIMWSGDAVLGVIALAIAWHGLLQDERRALARDAYRSVGALP